ncbi:hypothetical protein PSN45_001476 [Yamadazyma tenuis]|uniref:uncharacterized protein n=1 Tax=Candida tenuis TaxID=2315449 RepID=UPI0027A32EF1|nr:hypothetical protein PSN45_001476 [Yamadazyma tenuis]
MVEHIGSQVNVPGTRGKGILRYHGSIHGKTGIFAGIELLGPIALTRGKNSGDVEGFKYFEVQSPMSGLFLPFERLKAVNPQIDHTRDMINEATLNFNNDTLDDEIPTFSGLSSPNYSVNNSAPGINRPYSSQGYTSNSISVNKRQTSFSEKPRTSSVSSYNRSPVVNTSGTANSRSFSANGNNGNRLSNESMSYLEQELVEMRSKYEKSEREMVEKMSILNELKDTVQELQPILKQYESELDERDRKISKIRNEFESAREDWRQNLDIMVNTYEANEAYYETKIRELQSKVSEKSTFEDKSEQLKKLQENFNQLSTQKQEIENSLNIRITQLESAESQDDTKELNKVILDQQKEIESLSGQLMEVHKFPSQNSSALQEKVLHLEAEIEGLIHYKSRSSELEKEVVELKQDIERRHSLEKLEDKNPEINKLHDTINDLKDQLASKDKEIMELEDSLDKQVKATNNTIPDENSRITELEENLFFKDQEIKALQQQLDKTNSTVSTQKQRIKQLEAASSKTLDGTNTSDNSHITLLEQQVSEAQKLLCERENTIKELEQKLGESLSKELDSLNINDAAAMNEMTFREEVEQLRLQLDARPTIEELTELQDNIDEMVRLHNNEVFFKQEELQRVTNENSKLQVRLERALEGSIITNRISDNTSHDSMTINSLPIYKPENDTDPSTGKDNWCGLCERDGHNSLNCPYENDIF